MGDRALTDEDVEAIAVAVGKHTTCPMFSGDQAAALKMLSRVLVLAEKSVINATALSAVIFVAAAIGYGVIVLAKMATAKVWP